MVGIRLLIALFAILTGFVPVFAEFPMIDGGYTPENPLAGNVTENIRCVTYRCEGVTVADVREMSDPSYKPEEEVGCMTAIFCEDGTVFLRDFLSPFESTVGNSGSPLYIKRWVRGSLTEGGTVIEIPVGQGVGQVLSRNVSGYRFYPVLLDLGADGSWSWIIDETRDVIRFEILPGGAIRPVGFDDTHRFGCLFNDWEMSCKALLCPLFVPTESQPVLPRAGLVKEDWDFLFNSVDDDARYGEIGKRVKVVFDGDSVYIQGWSYLHPEAWVSGRKDGDSYVFAHSQLMAASFHLIPSTYSRTKDVQVWWGTIDIKAYTPSHEDFRMRYDPVEGCLSSSEDDWVRLGYGPDREVRYQVTQGYGPSGIGDVDVFSQSTFRRVPAGPRFPQSPEVEVIQTPYEGYTSKVRVSGSYFDVDGYVMDVQSLYYRLYIDGEPLVFTRENCDELYDMDDTMELLPFNLLNEGMDMADIREQYTFYVHFYFIPKDVRAEVVYLQDGVEYSSVGTVAVDSGERVTKETYDLLGRKVGEESLVPGIYVRDGKKILIK